HDDTRASLSISRWSGVWFCWGCAKKGPFHEIVEKTGTADQRTKAKDIKIPVAHYPYRDQDGRLIYEVVRYFPKTFRPFKVVDGRWERGMEGVPKFFYRLQEVSKLSPGTRVWIVEGKKDAEAMWAAGYPATTCSGGASGWQTTFAEYLKYFDV